MPEITEAEFREYIDLKRKQAEREKRIQEMLGKGPSNTKKWRTDLTTSRGMASVFANVLEGEWRRRGKPVEFVLARWVKVHEYLPERLLCIKKGKVNVKHTFRSHLTDFGWSFTINNKRGIFVVKRIS